MGSEQRNTGQDTSPPPPVFLYLFFYPAMSQQSEDVQPPKMDTFFMLDIMRLKNEKEMRVKKDAKIREMAMQQKAKIQAGKGSTMTTGSNYIGGYCGIPKTRGEGGKWTKSKRRQEEKQEKGGPGGNQDSEMFILSLLMEQQQKERDHTKVSEESLGCASDQEVMLKFER